MTELVWLHRFYGQELGIKQDGTKRKAGIYFLIPVGEARKIFIPDENFENLAIEDLNIPLFLPQINKEVVIKYADAYKNNSKRNEHRVYLSSLIDEIGEEIFRELISPGSIGCFYRKQDTICLSIAEEDSAYDHLLLDFPSGNKSSNLITETVFSSTENQRNHMVSESSDSYIVDKDYNELNKKTFPNTIYYGAPGTGKSYTIKEKLKSIPKERIETVTFHPDYDYTSFVGGYRPVSSKNDSGEDNIKYKFVPQIFTNMYVKSWRNPEEDFYLVIEEINRGNCAEIFGDIFQLLDQNQNYTVTPSSEMQDHLIDVLGSDHEGVVNGLKMPKNLSILATMNTSDQSLFPMDSAFKRRWDWEYIPIDYEKSDTNPSSKFQVYFANGDYFGWIDFIKAVNTKIKSNPNLGMDKCIGNYFIKPNEDSISLKTFINKAVFYLWNDVFKDEFGSESIFLEDITYEDFFPIEINGELQVGNIISNLEIEVVKVVDDA